MNVLIFSLRRVLELLLLYLTIAIAGAAIVATYGVLPRVLSVIASALPNFSYLILIAAVAVLVYGIAKAGLGRAG